MARQDEFDRAKDLYKWNRAFFINLGTWPLETTYVTFTVCLVYLCIHMTLVFADLYEIFGNLDLMIVNLSECTLEVMTLAKMFVMRFSKTLSRLMSDIIEGVDAKFFVTAEEREIYLNYNRIAKYFFKLWTTMGFSAAIMYYLKPMEFRIRNVFSNESVPFVLPYRTRLFFEVNDSKTFWLVYAYQAPAVYVHVSHAMTIGFLFSLLLHVCGLLAVLAYRIKKIDEGLRDEPQNVTLVFREIVGRHRTVMGLARDIDQVFQLLLLEELFFSTVILGLTSYTVLLTSDFSDIAAFLSFLSYGAIVLVLIYGYCIAGEYLLTESQNVYDAYYQCEWYDLSNTFKKQLMICIVGASKPLQLTGGGYYVFCLASFTDILKTAMGYMSMLRTIIN